ncbi:XRE family transcriptional regulator [Streptococcus uberis]|uniref:XRE family transcriptional regulator n=1 Tax=Streptococcus uberis TaxID=1349 RepID=UPI001FF4BBB3|nr:XRE family transcriptional regulator [Streptococcus uberis]MCK1228263.1 XRE family transcriptional regulator [Streptococcus uberis]
MDDSQIALFVGSKIRELRKSKGLTQKELAEKIGLGDTTIANYEKGFRTPKRNKIFKIAEVLGYPIDDFFPPTNKETNTTTIETPKDKLIKAFDVLSADSKNKLLKYAQLLQEAESTEYFEVITTTKLAAGVGYAFNEYDQKKVYVMNRPPKYDVASFVSGDSMEPKYHDGDIVYLVDKGLSSYSGEICAVAYEGKTYIKRVFTEAGRLRLESLNPKYPDFYIDFPPVDGGFIRIYEVIGTDTTVPI